MNNDLPLWEIVGGQDKGGILVRSGQEYTSTQYASRLAFGARVRELELIGDRLHYEKELGEGPDYGWISIKFKGKDLAVLVEVPRRDEEDEDERPHLRRAPIPREESSKPEAAAPAPAKPADAAAPWAAEPAAAPSPATKPLAGWAAEQESAPAGADGEGGTWEEAASAARPGAEPGEAAGEGEDLITVEAMTAAGPPQELTEEEKQRQALAEQFRAEMEMEAEAQRRCEVRGEERKGNGKASDRGVFLMVADHTQGQGPKILFVDAFNASLMKVKQEFAKKDVPHSSSVDIFVRLAASIVMFLNGLLPRRLRAGTAPRLERLCGLFANAESGLCAGLKSWLKEEKSSPDSGPSKVKEKLTGKFWQVLEILGQLPGLLLLESGSEGEEHILAAIHGYLAFYWHKAMVPAFGLPKERVLTKEPDNPVPPDECVPAELREGQAGSLCRWMFAVLFYGGDMLPDSVFFRPAAFSMRWRLMKTTAITMTQLLCELRARFSEDEFQRRYKGIRKNAGPGDEEAIIQCALTVQSVVLPKYGFSGDIRGVMEMRGEVAALTGGIQDMTVHKVMRDIHRALDYGEPLAKMPFTRFLETPRFSGRDRSAWLQHLNDQGFVVIADVASTREVEIAFDLLWSFIEHTDRSHSVRRDDVATWRDSDKENCGWPAGKDDGIIHSRGIGQSQLLWHLRSLPGVKLAYSTVWGTEHVVASFDGAGVFRPYGHKGSWKTKKTNWWHVDQAHRKRGLHCVQGLLTLTDATPATGGLVVVPGSHRFHGDILNSHAPKRSGWDYIGLEANEKVLTEGDGGPRLVSARAGDLVLWDSRTVHCNTLPLQEDEDLLNGDSLLRAVAYICMTPAAWCSEKVCNQRAAAFERGVTTSHWPHEFHAMDIDENSPPFTLSKAQRELLSPQTAPGWKEEFCRDAPKQGRICLMPEAKYRVAKSGGVDVYKSATTEWSSPVSSLKQHTEVTGYPIGKWLRLGSLPRNIPGLVGYNVDEENELWAQLSDDNGVVNFARVME